MWSCCKTGTRAFPLSCNPFPLSLMWLILDKTSSQAVTLSFFTLHRQLKGRSGSKTSKVKLNINYSKNTQIEFKSEPIISLNWDVNSTSRDQSFNLNDFIRTLRLELKSWRKVFWRLWGICHALYCSLCGSYFQVYMHEFCSFHPQDPEFPNIQFKNSTQPCGTYQCCQTSVNRFSPLPPSDKVR